jgi:hypothetical protein
VAARGRGGPGVFGLGAAASGAPDDPLPPDVVASDAVDGGVEVSVVVEQDTLTLGVVAWF